MKYDDVALKIVNLITKVIGTRKRKQGNCDGSMLQGEPRRERAKRYSPKRARE